MEKILKYLSDNPPIVAAAIGGIFIVIAALISLLGSDRWLRKKRNKIEADLRDTCPHVEIDHRYGELRIRSMCGNVSNGPLYVCWWCGSIFREKDEQELVDRWSTMAPVEVYCVLIKKWHKAKSLRRKRDNLGYD